MRIVERFVRWFARHGKIKCPKCGAYNKKGVPCSCELYSVRHNTQTIRKSCGDDGCGHCWEGCGWFKCDFYNTDEMAENGEMAAKCDLFGGASKWSSQALFICDKIYGKNYQGAP